MKTNKWRMFEAIVIMQDGSKRVFISCTLGDYNDAKKCAINNDWDIKAIDAIINFR